MNKTLPRLNKIEEGCALCPRACGVLREKGQRGRCGAGPLAQVRVARAAPHLFEEPCISGTRGSGTVFFAGCALGCRFCQNHAISRHADAGRAYDAHGLADVFLRLQAQGVHNLNLVTAGHWRPAVLEAVSLAKARGMHLPVVWNTGGYEQAGAARVMQGFVDVHLVDVKFYSDTLAEQLAGAPGYFEHAGAYLKEAVDITGAPRLDADGLLQSGVVARLLVLPGQWRDAVEILRWMARQLPKEHCILSLMSQYTPPSGLPALEKPLDRRLARYEYRKVTQAAQELGFELGYCQSGESASEEYLPDWEI